MGECENLVYKIFRDDEEYCRSSSQHCIANYSMNIITNKLTYPYGKTSGG